MPRGKPEQAEQIIPKLREVAVEFGRGKTVAEAVKKIGVTEQTYYRWKKRFGGLRMDQAKRREAVEHVRRAFGHCRVGVKTLYIEPGSPWEDGYVESFNGKLRDELLKRESFDTILEAKVLVDRWRQDYNTIRPHSAGLIEGENLT